MNDFIFFMGGAEAKYELAFIIVGLRNRMFSYFYHKDCSGMKLYFAGHCNNEQWIEQWIEQRLLSYHLINQKLTDMNLYFAGGENKHWLNVIEQAGGEKSLYSYFYLNKDNNGKPESFLKSAFSSQKRIFIDSGGYSAFTKGVVINIDEYCDWLLLYKNKFTTYAVLDVIGNHKATALNQAYMESKGLNPLPVFHYRSPYSVLENMAQKYNYIAIGGLVPIAREKEKLFRHLDKVFSISKDKIKIHGFGMTGNELLKKYPFYSVDSTSWLGGSMRAEINKFTGSDIISLETNLKNKITYSSFSFTDQNDKRWMARVINNAIEWIKYEKYITELWAKRGVIWND